MWRCVTPFGKTNDKLHFATMNRTNVEHDRNQFKRTYENSSPNTA